MKNALLFSFSLLALVACRRNDEAAVTPLSAIELAASETLAIPAAIELPAGAQRTHTFYAEGVQRYAAKPVTGGGWSWGLVGPDAKLMTASGAIAGTHGVGPHWTLSPADSIFGAAFAPARTAPPVETGAVDWLLLRVKPGTTPTGQFAGVQWIQRIATRGGKAPSTAPQSATDTVNVTYSAVYRFSK